MRLVLWQTEGPVEVEGLPDRTGGLSLRPAGNFEVERVFREESGKACAA
ncbi:MAG: hypothetical protein ACFCU2_10575 [Acidimicrobiia bacterium]